ncbi:hypothetical protein F7725_007368 [Dissostichus mawsoni]|uniref:Fasciculation and elongation protein zeta-1 n=1 Tax=Dissostichus mawsoni TaxID=36200 RepID=A0A7J5XWM1_DISMA|nr:hypothetical protein F7725_007368 [Dissostichus mawsoni]
MSESSSRRKQKQDLLDKRLCAGSVSCWLPIDWKTTGCGRTDKGGCGLTGEGRDTDRSNDHLYLPDFLSFPWNECSCCCSSVGFAATGGLGSDSPALKIQAAASRPTAASPAGNLSPCSHPAVHRTVLTPLRSLLYTILPPSFSESMEAPLVCLDEEFEDLRLCHMDELDHPALQQSSYSSTSTIPLSSITREDFSELENFSEMMSFKSMEDLVNEFDEKLNVCFHNYNTKTECLAPIRNQTHSQEDEEQLQDEDGQLNGVQCAGWRQCRGSRPEPASEEEEEHKDPLSALCDRCWPRLQAETSTMIVWDALTDNYISTWDGNDSEGLNGNLSDQEIHEKEEEEMNEKNDNANCLNEEPLITADQVIEEIDEMMENSPDPVETEEEDEEEESSHCSSSTSPSLLEEIRQLSLASNNNCSYEAAQSKTQLSPAGLTLMPSSGLVELLQRVEATIREFSEELVGQLARREELDFEKEVKNTFITALMEVQNRQREQRDSSKRRRRDKTLSLQGGGTPPVTGGNTAPTANTEKTGSMPVKRFSMEGLSNILQTGIRQTFGSTGNEKQKKGIPPTVEDLQMLTKSKNSPEHKGKYKSTSG